MTTILICVGVLIFLAGILAAVSAEGERNDARELHEAVTKATEGVTEKLEEVLKGDMGASMITARADALGEFLGAMPDLAQTERRSRVPFLVTVVASLLIIGATTSVVIDRIAQRDEHNACLETAAQLPDVATTATTLASPTTTTLTSTTTTAAAASGSTGGQESAGSPPSTTAKSQLAPPADRAQFLATCVDGHDRTATQRREPHRERPTATSSTTSSTTTSSTTATTRPG